jgi:NADPH2:quinone reductase
MKAIRIYEQGEPEVMKLEDVPQPAPNAGEVRVKVYACGINFIDIYQRSGQYKINLPYTLGLEASGTVDAVGAGVSDFKVGDTVAYGFTAGAYAEYAVVPADKLVHVPTGVRLDYAAAIMLQGMTAHYLTHDTWALQPGQTALVHAAAGGTGALVVQLAKIRGARVIAIVSTPEKAVIAKAAGADDVIFYDGFDTLVRELTAGKGVDVVYDSVGKDTFERSLNCLRPRGLMALFGQASGAVSPVDLQILNAKGSLFVTRPSLGHYVATHAELMRRANDIFGWVADGKLKVNIGRIFPLANAAEAHRALFGRVTTGKLLLVI